MTNRKTILLISANRLSIPYPVYPIGLSYISAYLEENLPDFGIELFDLNLKTEEALQEYLITSEPQYIGISFRNADDANSENSVSFIDDYEKLVQLVRNYSKSPLIIGGSAFSIYPEIFFKRLKPDFGIAGEGEYSMHKLIVALENKQDFQHLEGLIYSDGHQIKVNPKSCLQIMPNKLSYNDKLTDFYWKHSGMMNIQTKRGCPKHCIYCTYPLIEGNKTRTVEIDEIIEDLSFFYFKKNINYFFITDSVFNVGEEYNVMLAEKMISRGIKIQWGAYFTPQNLNPETMKLYKRAGLKHVEFGTESFSDKQLKNYGKSFTFEEVLKSSEICNDAGVYFAHFLILCGYGETEETLNETFANSMKIRNAIIFPYTGMRIYPGTILQKLAIRENRISSEQDLLRPVHYISDKVNLKTIRERAEKTGKKWIFPEDDYSEMIDNMRANNKKGPLWHLIR